MTSSSSSPAFRAPGKSSLASTPSYAEGQRRYVESLSSYARQFLGQMEKPDIDSIDGLSPAVSIDQKPLQEPAFDGRHHDGNIRLPAPALRAHRHPALPHMRARHREADRRPDCGPHHGPQRAGRSHHRHGARRARPQGRVAKFFEDLVRGLLACASTERCRLDEGLKLDKKYKHDIEVIIDRIVLKEGQRAAAPGRGHRDGHDAHQGHRAHQGAAQGRRGRRPRRAPSGAWPPPVSRRIPLQHGACLP